MKKIFSPLALLLLLASAAGTAGAEATIDELAFVGGAIDYSERRGYLDFGGGRVEEVDTRSLATFGPVFGKRWKIFRRLRLQVMLDLKYGSTSDTLPPISLIDADGNAIIASTKLKTSLFTGGCLAELHYPMSVSPDGRLFLIGGAGLHAARVRETEMLLDGSTVINGDPYPEGNHFSLSASVNAGMGFEIIVSPVFGVAFSYSLRYWHPIGYEMSRDLFPDHPIGYTERFLSHEITFVFLARR